MTFKYINLTPELLLEEYIRDPVKETLRFGQYMVNKYVEGFDSLVFYEPNNGVAYKYILQAITKNTT